MGFENPPRSTPLQETSSEVSEVERTDKDIQEDLRIVKARIAAIPEDQLKSFGTENLLKIESMAHGTEHETTLQPENHLAYEEWDSLASNRIALEKERGTYFRNNPTALKSRYEEIVKDALRKNLASDPDMKEQFMEIMADNGLATRRMWAPQEGSENWEEFNDLQSISSEKYQERGGFESDSDPSPWDAAAEVYKEMLQAESETQITSETAEKISTQIPEFLRNNILQQDLSYQDAEVPQEMKRGMLEQSQVSESAQRYAESLANASNAGGLDRVRKLGKEMRDTMLAEASRLNIPVSPFGKSASWAMWDIGKQYHFFTHQDQNDPRYEIGNPLESESKREEILNRHIGWEAYAAFRNNPEYKTRVQNDPRLRDALRLFTKEPKANQSLSSNDLAELGKMLRDS